MKLSIQLIGWLVGLPLEILILRALLRGPYRRFPVVFAYMLASAAATLAEAFVALAGRVRGGGGQATAQLSAQMYWVSEAFLLPLLLGAVLNLIWQASERIEKRHLMRAVLVSVAVLAPLVSGLLHFNSGSGFVGEWMTPWTRDLNFCSAILDLLLWTLLIFSREKDTRLLLLSGGLGIQFTGEAIGGSIRNFAIAYYRAPTPAALAVVMVGSVVSMMANLACLYIWRQAFRAESPAPGLQRPAELSGEGIT